MRCEVKAESVLIDIRRAIGGENLNVSRCRREAAPPFDENANGVDRDGAFPKAVTWIGMITDRGTGEEEQPEVSTVTASAAASEPADTGESPAEEPRPAAPSGLSEETGKTAAPAENLAGSAGNLILASGSPASTR